ncbi:MAG: lactate utilization protein [Acidobacteriota bacterium]
MSARDRVLAAAREGLGRAAWSAHGRTPGPGPSPSGDGRRRRPSGDADTRALLVEQFTAALTALGGQAHTADSPGGIIDIVTSLFDRYACCDFISWEADEIPCPGLLDALASHGRRRVAYDVPFDQVGRAAVLASLEPVGIGLTGGLAAVASSGTIALASGKGRGRLASLLPPVHIAVIRTRALVASLDDVVTAHPSLVAEGSNIVFITGPSRTADIEMTLTRGVHGPRHVHVVLLTEAAP